MNIRVSEGVKGFKQKAIEIWGVKDWDGKDESELLFFGLYFPEDYQALKDFKGSKSIFWCGSDILRTMRNPEYQAIVEEEGIKHYCENEAEEINLKSIGITPEVIPSFLGSVYSYPVSFKRPRIGEFWKMWLCAHPQREGEYGVHEAIELTKLYSNLQVHIYGIDGESSEQVIYHGKVLEEQLDKEIRDYHCGFRANFHDGVSEVIMKSLFLGQYPIARLKYEGVMSYSNWDELVNCIEELFKQVEPNLKTRCIWIKKVNSFPWSKQQFWNANE